MASIKNGFDRGDTSYTAGWPGPGACVRASIRDATNHAETRVPDFSKATTRRANIGPLNIDTSGTDNEDDEEGQREYELRKSDTL